MRELTLHHHVLRGCDLICDIIESLEKSVVDLLWIFTVCIPNKSNKNEYESFVYGQRRVSQVSALYNHILLNTCVASERWQSSITVGVEGGCWRFGMSERHPHSIDGNENFQLRDSDRLSAEKG